MTQTWHFIDDNGAFELEAPHRNSYLYFPLVNEAGMMSSITPLLHGDIKTDQNHFLLSPVSVDDLHTWNVFPRRLHRFGSAAKRQGEDTGAGDSNFGMTVHCKPSNVNWHPAGTTLNA